MELKPFAVPDARRHVQTVSMSGFARQAATSLVAA
jgi:hypothetical protein